MKKALELLQELNKLLPDITFRIFLDKIHNHLNLDSFDRNMEEDRQFTSFILEESAEELEKDIPGLALQIKSLYMDLKKI